MTLMRNYLNSIHAYLIHPKTPLHRLRRLRQDEQNEEFKNEDQVKRLRFMTTSAQKEEPSSLKIDPNLEVGEYIAIKMETYFNPPSITRDKLLALESNTANLRVLIEDEEFDSDGLTEDVDCYDDINDLNYNPKQSNVYRALAESQNKDETFKSIWDRFITAYDQNIGILILVIRQYEIYTR